MKLTGAIYPIIIKLLKFSVFTLLVVLLFYLCSGWIPYKKDLTLKYVINNKIYSFLKNNFNDGQNFEPSMEYDDHHDELEQLSILIDSLKWSKLKLNYLRYIKSDKPSKNIPISEILYLTFII